MGIPLPSYKCKLALEDAQLRAAIAAIAECSSASAEVLDIYAELTVCAPLFVVQDIYIRIVAAALCLATGGGQPFAPTVQLWDGVADVVIEPGVNVLRLTAPIFDGRQITLPPVSGYNGGLYVAIDLGLNSGIQIGQIVVPDGSDTIDGAASMVPTMGPVYYIFTPSGDGNWVYQITNNDDPRFYRTFTILAGFGGDFTTPHIKVTPAAYNGNDTSWVGHNSDIGGYGGFMIPVNANDPLRFTDKFNFPIDTLHRHPLSSNIAEPVPTLGTGAGTIGAGAELALQGSDTIGWVRVLTGADATGVGQIFTLPFDADFPFPPAVILQAGDDTTRLADANLLYAPLDTTTTSVFNGTMPTGKSLLPNTTYRWRYHVFGGL